MPFPLAISAVLRFYFAKISFDLKMARLDCSRWHNKCQPRSQGFSLGVFFSLGVITPREKPWERG